MPTDFDLSELMLNQATMEIRYDNAYILWDRTGLIWSEVSSKLPKLKMNDVNPNLTKFLLDDRFELAVSLDRSHCIDKRASSSLSEFSETSENFLNVVIKCLEVSKFSRLGFRLTYIKEFPDKASAAEYLISKKVITVPSGKHFGINGKILLPRYSLMWEGESTAARIILEVRSQRIDLETDIEAEEIKPVHLERHQFVYDIDYFTLQPTSKGQLNIKEWISQAYHLVRRDSRFFFGG
jgi:hypothetical protein